MELTGQDWCLAPDRIDVRPLQLHVEVFSNMKAGKKAVYLAKPDYIVRRFTAEWNDGAC